MRKSGSATTIIKRSARRAHSGVHTGAWKVAFADFTLAMMALFMVMWIMGAVSEKERREIVAQLNGISIFNGTALFGEGGKSPLSAVQLAAALPQESAVVVQPRDELGDLRELIQQLSGTLHAQDNLSLERIPQGLRVLLQDDDKRIMFARGSAQMSPWFSQLLSELAPVFNQSDHQIIISGHTDSVVYPNGSRYNNWSLSGDRAQAARQVMENHGLDFKRIIQVNAVADRVLLDKEHPDAASNRRIEIMVLTQAAAESLYQFYGYHGAKVVKPIADRIQ